MDQEIDYVNSCYGDDDLDYAKYADTHSYFLEADERVQANSITQSTQNRYSSNSMIDSSNSNGSFISHQVVNSIQEVEMKTSFNEFCQATDSNCDKKNQDCVDIRNSTDNNFKNVNFNYESISNCLQENRIALLHGEIPIQKQSIYNGITDSEFMMSDVLQQYKQVSSLIQTSNFLHVELTQLVQSSYQDVSNILSQWEQEKNTEKAWNNDQNYINSDSYQGCFYNQSFDLTLFINQYISTITNQQSYFYENQNLVQLSQQNYQSQERYENINKRAFKILKKLYQAPKSNIFTYKIVRKSPFEYSTLSRGVSNAFFDKLGLDKQEISQYIMRNHSLPFNSEVTTQERIRQNVEEILTHNSFIQENRSFKRTFSNGDASLNAFIQQQIYPLNEQLGDQNIDINDYLIVDVISFDEKQNLLFSNKMKERKLQFGFCFSSTDFHYKTMSSNIVDRYYQNYSEQQRQENQILRLLNKKNHRFH